MDNLLQTIKEINWDFSDRNSKKYPLDLNSIPYYIATFTPPIPKTLIKLLSNPGDIVFDPFGGSGTTVIEALKQNRLPIYNDLNPFAIDMLHGLLAAIKLGLDDTTFLTNEADLLSEYFTSNDSIEEIIAKYGINEDVYAWYDLRNLKELCLIVKFIHSCAQNTNDPNRKELYYIRKLALASILKSISAQTGHTTYFTDNCKPTSEQLKKRFNQINISARKSFLEKLELIKLSSNDLIKQYSVENPQDSLLNYLERTQIYNQDARKIEALSSNSVDLVVTSPPYLCAQDYIKTMRPINWFFPNPHGFQEVRTDEIGPRSKRRGNPESVVSAYYRDMHLSFEEINRVLVPGAYFCLILGKSTATILEPYDIISDCCSDIRNSFQMEQIYRTTRLISNRNVQVGGIDKEDIIIFRKSSN